ncbi:MAG: hypothetical protein OEU36_09490 [Gammaproteobacteria bacterium]|nr:hypothetical protein [Gammaproteobacteria bacterium]
MKLPKSHGQLRGTIGGCDNDGGQLRTVLMHRPDPEFNIIDPTNGASLRQVPVTTPERPWSTIVIL